MTTLLPWLLVLPFSGAVFCLLFRKRAAGIGVVAAAGTAVVAGLTLRALLRLGPQRVQIGGWGAPLGIDVALDGLSMLHLLMTAVVGLLVSLYAQRYFHQDWTGQKGRARELFWPLWFMLWGAMNALFLSADLFNLYVVMELIGLSAVGLLVLTGTSEVLRAGLRYLLAALAGSMIFLLGVVLLYAETGTLDLYAMEGLLHSNPVTRAALTLMTLGLMMKTAVFPLHFWLPSAHSSATAPVSALLSALVVKGSFYVFLRLWFEVFPGVTTPATGSLLAAMGSAAIVWGSLQALRQQRLKMLIAYSTVAQLGYLFFLFPVSVAAAPTTAGMSPWVLEAGNGALCHVVSHALAKASIFLSAGVVLHAVGSDRIADMRGLADRMPLTVFSMALAAVSLMGLPPSGGFIAKWLTMHAVLGVGQWWWAVFVVLGGLLTASYMFRMLRCAFMEAPPESRLHPVPRSMELCALGLALVSIGIGIRATGMLNLLMIGNPFGGGGA